MYHVDLYFYSHSYAFHVAAAIGTGVDTFYNLIEDIIAQADEVDDQYMQVGCGKSWHTFS